MLPGGVVRVALALAVAVLGEADGVEGGGDEADEADAGDGDADGVEGGRGEDGGDDAADDDQRERRDGDGLGGQRVLEGTVTGRDGYGVGEIG